MFSSGFANPMYVCFALNIITTDVQAMQNITQTELLLSMMQARM
jgi:hypothetical protein